MDIVALGLRDVELETALSGAPQFDSFARKLAADDGVDPAPVLLAPIERLTGPGIDRSRQRFLCRRVCLLRASAGSASDGAAAASSSRGRFEPRAPPFIPLRISTVKAR